MVEVSNVGVLMRLEEANLVHAPHIGRFRAGSALEVSARLNNRSAPPPACLVGCMLLLFWLRWRLALFISATLIRDASKLVCFFFILQTIRQRSTSLDGEEPAPPGRVTPLRAAAAASTTRRGRRRSTSRRRSTPYPSEIDCLVG